MAERNAVKDEFHTFVVESGMSKHGGSWYRPSDSVIAVLNLQKSQYSLSYYVNLAFWLRALGDTQFPPENKCHVRMRMDQIIPDRSREISSLLDLTNEIPDRERKLHDAFREVLKPLLDHGSALEGLRQLAVEGVLERAFVLNEARALLARSVAEERNLRTG